MKYCKRFKTGDRVRHEARPGETATIAMIHHGDDKLTVRWPDGALMVDLAYHFDRETRHG
jgi:hypothetical protein